MSEGTLIDYNHELNSHSLHSPELILPVVFGDTPPSSLLDVGCGRGTWLRAATNLGVPYLSGIDGVLGSGQNLLVPDGTISFQDLRKPWNLDRNFDMALCLETAEHIQDIYAESLIESLTRHSKKIIFSAACPGQPGQNHLNCQWPDYWQKLFNQAGFVCSDTLRWNIWDDNRIEPWYRQNIFIATRDDEAGTEARIMRVRHPDAWWWNDTDHYVQQIANGLMPPLWYITTPFMAFVAKLRRRIF